MRITNRASAGTLAAVAVAVVAAAAAVVADVVAAVVAAAVAAVAVEPPTDSTSLLVMDEASPMGRSKPQNIHL